MKILLIAYACEPGRGSEPGAGWNWAYHLANYGHEVFVVTRPNGKSAIEKELGDKKVKNLHVIYIDIPKFQKKFIKGQLGVYLHYFIWQHYALKKVQCIKRQFDLVHHVTWSGMFGGSVFWKLDLPFVYGPCGGGQIAPKAFSGLFGSTWRREEIRNIVVRLLQYVPTTQSFLRHTDILLVTNRETFELVKKAGSKNTRYFLDSGLPSDYLPSFPIRRDSGEELRILWVARLYPIKGLVLALKAVQKVQVPVHLTIVGNGPLGPKVLDLIRSYGLEDKVDWWGQVPWMGVKKAYETNDVFLFTSLRESFGAQLLEAMAYGLPIITLNHFGARDFVPDAASIKVPVTNPEDVANNLARSIDTLWHFPLERERMGKASYEFAQSQTWDRRVEKLSKIYDQLIDDYYKEL